MKLLPLTILLTLAFSCASSKPPVWRDQYGVIHIENVDPVQVGYVKVLQGSANLPGGCIKLRNIYLSGTAFKDWELKVETAKMQGTHVVKQYYNGLSDTLGAAYNCTNRHAIQSMEQWRKVNMRNQALSELERRTYEKKKIVQTKDSIPVIEYNGYK